MRVVALLILCLAVTDMALAEPEALDPSSDSALPEIPLPEMVSLSGGRFLMGAARYESESDKSDKPQRWVTVAPFELGRTEVTRAQFAVFVDDSGYRSWAETQGGCWVRPGISWKADAERDWRDPGIEQQADHPVTCIHRQDALAYIAWLNEKTGQNYRLPSEAEWEYAARLDQEPGRFWHGEDPAGLCAYANFIDHSFQRQLGYSLKFHCEDGYAQTMPVAQLAPTGSGLYDLYGNVWEWVQDCWHDSYEGAPEDGRAWQSDCADVCAGMAWEICDNSSFGVVRGGSWYSPARRVRSAKRKMMNVADYSLGFRLARTP